ncbi:response regulator [Oceaniglobus roseus]|uniref:response regulator n=1 Tax=Oceaniglobus roseus TaxID=1737570 RepID=UPI000C7F4BB3|nr:response regulator [Kandeliimicrobium roseum]
MACEGLSGSEAQLCQAVEAASRAAAAAEKLAAGQGAADRFVAVTEALSALLIPAAVLFLIVRLWPVLQGIFETRKFTVKMGPFELSAQEATDQLRAQIDDLQSKVAALSEAKPSLADWSDDLLRPFGAPPAREGEAPRKEGDPFAPDAPGGLFPEPPAQSPAPSPAPPPPASATRPPQRILWVDDEPSGNAALIAAFQAEGLEVELVRTTREAIAQLWAEPDRFAVVITDQGRLEELGTYVPDAGTRLLKQMQGADIRVPTVVYTSARGVRQGGAALEAGAGLVTDSPTDVRGFVFRHTGLRHAH